MYKVIAAATLTLALAGAGCATAPVAYYPAVAGAPACQKVTERVRPNGTPVAKVRTGIC